MAYQFKDEQEFFEATQMLAHILTNLRYWTKEWERLYGSERKNLKLKWEAKADQFIEKYGMEYQPQINPEQLKKPQ